MPPTSPAASPGPSRWIYLGAEIGCGLAAIAVLAMFVATRHLPHALAGFGLGGCAILYDRQRRRVTADPSQTMPGATIGVVFGLAAISIIFLRTG